eukprot:353721-Chlamydomonas_euryale.AAC.1
MHRALVPHSPAPCPPPIPPQARNQLLKTARSLIEDWHLHHKQAEPSAGDSSGNGVHVGGSEHDAQAPSSPPRAAALDADAPPHAHGARSGVGSQQSGGDSDGPPAQQSPALSSSLGVEPAVGGRVVEEAIGRAASAYVPHAPPALQQLRSGGVPKRGLPSVAPGSFLDVLLAARKRQAHGQPLNDLQIIAQVWGMVGEGGCSRSTICRSSCRWEGRGAGNWEKEGLGFRVLGFKV